MKVSVILPTFNEKENITTMINQILKYVKDLEEIIVVDDNSPDKTWEIVQNYDSKKVRCIRRIKERGLASAIATGIDTAKGDVVVWMDCDLSMPPTKIPELLEALEKTDIAVGSRYVKGGKDNRSFLRVSTSRLMNLFTNLVLNFNVLDYDSGFLAVKKHVFKEVPLSRKGYGEYCIAFLYKAGRKGYKIKEIPYTFIDRTKGESKTAQNFLELLYRGVQYCSSVIKVRFNV